MDFFDHLRNYTFAIYRVFLLKILRMSEEKRQIQRGFRKMERVSKKIDDKKGPLSSGGKKVSSKVEYFAAGKITTKKWPSVREVPSG